MKICVLIIALYSLSLFHREPCSLNVLLLLLFPQCSLNLKQLHTKIQHFLLRSERGVSSSPSPSLKLPCHSAHCSFYLCDHVLWFPWSGCVPSLAHSNGRQGERKPVGTGRNRGSCTDELGSHLCQEGQTPLLPHLANSGHNHDGPLRTTGCIWVNGTNYLTGEGNIPGRIVLISLKPLIMFCPEEMALRRGWMTNTRKDRNRGCSQDEKPPQWAPRGTDRSKQQRLQPWPCAHLAWTLKHRSGGFSGHKHRMQRASSRHQWPGCQVRHWMLLETVAQWHGKKNSLSKAHSCLNG